MKLPLTSDPAAPTEAEPSDDFLKDEIFEDFNLFLEPFSPILLLFEVRDFAALGMGDGFILWEF